MGDILIIDDDAGIRTVMSRFLRDAGHRVTVAGELAQGLAHLAEKPYEVIYCDINLPGGSGLELLDEVKLRPNPPLVIIITGFPTLETAQQALRNGAFDYLVKPILLDALGRSINRAVQAKALRDEKERLRLHLEAVFHSVDEGLITVDLAFRLVAANAAAERICGLGAEAVGQPMEGLTGRHCGGECLALLQRVVQRAERVTQSRFPCHSGDRTAQVVSVTATPLWDASRSLCGVVMAVKDETRVALLEKDLDQRSRFRRLVGRSPAMTALYRLIEDLAEVETTVLITGPSGVGKELAAEALHLSGRRAKQPLVKVNCVALSETLLESELFGHVRGAFTGALRDRLGRFQEAHKGTILLDEIGDISPHMQLRLLRFLQERTIERVGDNRSIPVDTRIIAATNQDLAAKVAQGTFREDLYYRLKVVEMRIPPLRERREDIPVLTGHFIQECNARFGKEIQGVEDEAMAALLHYPWPGNVRELAHAIEHAFVLCHRAHIAPAHLPREVWLTPPGAPPAAIPPPEEEGERSAILRVLAETNWHREKAAKAMGMSRSTFFRRLKQLGIAQ